MENNVTQVRTIREKKGMQVIWQLGNFCTYKCSYCGPAYNDGTNKYHSFDNIVNIFSKLPEYSSVIFSGGEPTYHPDIEEIFDSKPATIQVGVISNGARPGSFWERVVPKLSPIILTFHAEYAKIDRFIETATICKPKLQRVNLTMIPALWDTCVEAYNEFIDNGIPVSPKPLVQDFGFHSAGLIAGYSLAQLDWISSKNAQSEIKYMGFYDKDGNLLKETSPSEMLSSKETNFQGWECYTPLKTLYINSDGKIYDTSCRQRRQLGTVDSGFELPTEPVICKQNFCWCHPDISPAKVRQ